MTLIIKQKTDFNKTEKHYYVNSSIKFKAIITTVNLNVCSKQESFFQNFWASCIVRWVLYLLLHHYVWVCLICEFLVLWSKPESHSGGSGVSLTMQTHENGMVYLHCAPVWCFQHFIKYLLCWSQVASGPILRARFEDLVQGKQMGLQKTM